MAQDLEAFLDRAAVMAETGPVSRRTFGTVDAAVVHSGYIHWLPEFEAGQEWVTPDTQLAPDGKAAMGINWLLVRTPDAVVLVDPCSMTPEVSQHPSRVGGLRIEPALEELRLDPAEVTHVVITHGHGDHVLGLVDRERAPDEPRFPHADVVFQEADWQAQVIEDRTNRAHELLPFLEPVRRAGKLRLVDGDVTLAAGVTVVHTPGESEGHQIARIDTPEGPIYYLGDLVHFPIEFQHPDWKPHVDMNDDAVASRRRIFGAAAAERATVVFTHGRFPAWGRVEEAGPGSWRWRYLE